jgi:hypothetical protein
MGVIGFICVSLGSSTIQLLDSLGSTRACACSKAGFSSQNGHVLEHTIEEQRSVVFLWTKGFNVKDIHKEMFPVYGGKCLLHKAIHNWMANVSLMTKKLKRRCGSGRDNTRKTNMLLVLTHW